MANTSVEHGVDEGLRVERRQIVGAFTETDQLDRHAQLTLHQHDDAALGSAVQLGQNHAGDVGGLREIGRASCRERVYVLV